MRKSLISAVSGLTIMFAASPAHAMAGPDLTPTETTFPTSDLTPGSLIFFDSGIRNKGDLTATEFNIRRVQGILRRRSERPRPQLAPLLEPGPGSARDARSRDRSRSCRYYMPDARSICSSALLDRESPAGQVAGLSVVGAPRRNLS
ncbi:hypothetical protein Acor_73570 [Acrocarpospora corrugata]|uniref:Uncharacterized protein n=1 Tax=Acrocarpospora corrugata TaxID=35763 RepID=A0A5M3WAA8_9ACTN|nr:hypothetical protein Acor_73570 [Acrocarpospora corrugata]